MKFARCDEHYEGYDPAICAELQAIERGEQAPAEAPGWLQKAANLAQAVVTHVAAGMPKCDLALAASRLAVCHACDQLDAPRMVCTQCGCHVETKARWSDQHCPINKW